VAGTRVADTRVGRSPAVGIPAGRTRAVGIPAGRTRAVGIRAADNRQRVQVADTPVAGTVVDQAILAAVPVVRKEVPSPDSAPDVVAHEPILSTGGSFLNVPPISVA
jgi:hypothetical protein